MGACALGLTACVDGGLLCEPNIPPEPETCANPIEDDDCNGVVDDVPEVGAPCDSGVPGRCAAGSGACDGQDPICIPDLEPRVEQCANVIDDDCDGEMDEAECDDVTTCDELEDPRQSAMDACLLVFPNCVDTGSAGVIGYANGSCQGCNCDPEDRWQMFCYATARDDYNCAECTLGEIQRSHEPCNCNDGTTPAIGAWCPQQ